MLQIEWPAAARKKKEQGSIKLSEDTENVLRLLERGQRSQVIPMIPQRPPKPDEDLPQGA